MEELKKGVILPEYFLIALRTLKSKPNKKKNLINDIDFLARMFPKVPKEFIKKIYESDVVL